MKSKRKTIKEKSKEKVISRNSVSSANVRPYSALIYILLFGTGIVLYANTFGHKYTFDDSIAITENEYTQKGIAGIPELLNKDFFEGIYGEQLEVTGGRYRPLSLITFAIEYEFFGKNAFIGHIINVFLYALLLVLLFKVIFHLSNSALVSFIAALLFAAHPIHTEVVANIKSRDEILCLMMGLLAYLSFVKFDASQGLKRKIWALLGLFAFLLALLAKETAVVFLVLIPAGFYVSGSLNLHRSFMRSLLLLSVFLGYFILRTSLVGMPGGSDSSDIMENPFVNSSLSEKYATIFIILGKYLKLLFFPYPLSCDYSYNQIPLRPWNIEAVLWMLLYIFLLVYAVIKIFKKDIAALAILFFILPLLLTSNLLFNIGAPLGERFLFIPSVGFCLAISLVLCRFPGKGKKIELKPNIKLAAIILPILLAFSWRTVDRNKVWSDNLTLFSTDVKTVPNSAKIHYYYGNILLNRYITGKKDPARLKLANKEFKTATQINPKFHWAQYNLGKSYDLLGRYDSAIIHFEKVLEINPTHIATQGILGSIYGQRKQNFQKAIYHLNKSIEFGDFNKANFHNLAIAHALSNNLELAIVNFRKALDFAPNDARVHFELGHTLNKQGKAQEGEFHLNKSYELDPNLRNY